MTQPQLASDDDRILLATRKGLFSLRRRGPGDWGIERVSFLGDNLSLALADRRDGTWYAALDHGHFGAKMQRSRDAGATWEECAAPTYPPQPEGRTDQDGMGRAITWSTKKIWALATGGAGERGTLWCGTIPGGLFRSTDGAASWQLVESLWNEPLRGQWFGGGADEPGIHSVLVDPRDPQRLVVGVSCGGVWRSADGGATWSISARGMRAAFMPPERQEDEAIQDPHCIVQAPSAPDVFWAQHHNGIFRSGDGARSWQEVTEAGPSTFGFPVAVHPRDPDTAWFVPAVKDEKRYPVEGRLVVTRTRDGGRSFDTLRDGLPQEHAYDLVYRHGLDVSVSGNRLVFGSTTGNVWVSEDGGDHWQAAARHLPPVYAARFAL